MVAGHGIPSAQARARQLPALPLALAALLFLAMHATTQAEQVPAQGDETGNTRAVRGVGTPRLLSLFQDWCAVARAESPGRSPGYASPPLLKPQAGSLSAANPVAGTEFTLTPSVRVQQATDNNVMFQDVSDQEYRLSPQLEGRLRTERTILTMRAAADVLRYARYKEFDRTNQEFSLGMRYAATRRTGLELRGHARSDHTLESALEESGTVAVKSPRHNYGIQPTLAYRPDERTEIRLGGEATTNKSPHRHQKDALTQGGFLGLSRNLGSTAAALLVRTGFTTTSYDTGRQSTATLAGGMEWKITETLSCLLSVGPSISRDRFSTRSEGETHRGLAGEGRIRLELERATLELGADMGAIPGSGGEDTLRRRILGKSVIHLTERLDLILNAAWFRSRTLDLVSKQDNTVVRLSPGLEYALGEHTDLHLGYDYTCIDDHVAGVYRQRQQIFLSLRLEYPRMLQ